MQDILLHPGFHRTGTSSMQHFAWRNHEKLAPYVELMMLRHLKPVIRHCAHFATTQNPLDLLELSELLDTAFQERGLTKGTNLLISCEGLCGQMPGRPDVDSYNAAPLLIQYIVSYLQDRFPDARTRVILTTRTADTWLRSVYRYQLRATRLTMKESDFIDRYAGIADFDALLGEIADLLGETEVVFLPLEEAAVLSSGPGGALFQQCELPADVRHSLIKVGQGNEGPKDRLTARFLRLNRSDLNDADLVLRKKTLAEANELGAWKKV